MEVQKAKDQARNLAQEAVGLYEQGKYEEALSRFQAAHSLYPSPQSLVYIARSNDKLGHLLAARDAYQQVVDEKLPADASKKIKEAVAVAQAEFDDLKKRIPVLVVSVKGAALGDVHATIDGKPVSVEDLARAEVDPGTHEVVWKAPSKVTITRSVLAKVGEVVREDVEFVPDLNALANDSGSAAAGSKGGPGGRNSMLWPATAGFGVGAVGLGVGIAAGVAALGKVDELRAQCPTKQCSPADKALADEANSLGTVSTVGFVAAGLGAAAGVILLVVGRSTSKAPSQDALPGTKESGGATVSLRVSPTSFFLTGEF